MELTSSRDTGSRILDAVLSLVSRSGLRSLTLEDVASEAGVSRQTIYRWYGTRDELIRATVVREEAILADEARTAAAGCATLEEAAARSVTTLLEGVRRHPLIDRLLASEPGSLLPYLTMGDGPVLSLATSIVGELVEGFVPDREVVDELSDVLSRLVISYTVAPGTRSPEEVGRLAARIVSGGLVTRD